jgi:Zn-finger nucleic acid-binding protein
MQPLLVVGVEIDFCTGCGGIWLDEGEIKALAAAPAVTLDQVRALDNQIPSVNPVDPGKSTATINKPCPACGGKLTNAEFSGTNVEHCNGCHGIFVDRGELQRTMQLVDTTEATTIVALARSVETSGEL